MGLKKDDRATLPLLSTDDPSRVIETIMQFLESQIGKLGNTPPVSKVVRVDSSATIYFGCPSPEERPNWDPTTSDTVIGWFTITIEETSRLLSYGLGSDDPIQRTVGHARMLTRQFLDRAMTAIQA